MKIISIIKNGSLVILVGLIIWFVIDYNNEKSERKRYQQNQSELLNELSYSITRLKFNDEELTDYLKKSNNSTAGLYEKILARDKRMLKRIQQIVSTTIISKDTTPSKIILDSLGAIYDAINRNVKLEIPIDKKSKCFELKAKFVMEDGTSRIEFIEQKFIDTVNYVGYWERRKWKLLGIIPTRLFGKKIAKVEVFNNCGLSKTIVIDKIN